MDLEDLILWVLSVVFVVAIILFFQGHFIDLSINRQAADLPRAAINLLNSISSSSNLLVEDFYLTPIKNSFDRLKLADPFASSDCCSTLQYDYLLKVTNFAKKENDNERNFYVSDLDTTPKTPFGAQSLNKFVYFSKISGCYGAGYLATASAERFVNICDAGKCDAGVASIEIAETPLSQLAFWISRACNDKQNFVKQILIGKNDIDVSSIKIDTENSRVCMRTAGSNKLLCKRYVCDSNQIIEDERDQKYETYSRTSSIFDYQKSGCFFVQVSKIDSKRVVSLPPYEELTAIEPIPNDYDAWTELTAIKFKPARQIFGSNLFGLADYIPGTECTKVSDDSSIYYGSLNAGKNSIRFDKLAAGCNVDIKFSEFGTDHVDGTVYNKLNLAMKMIVGVQGTVLKLVLKDGSKDCPVIVRYENSPDWNFGPINLDISKINEGNSLIPNEVCPQDFKMNQIKSISFSISHIPRVSRVPYTYPAENVWIDNLFFSK